MQFQYRTDAAPRALGIPSSIRIRRDDDADRLPPGRVQYTKLWRGSLVYVVCVIDESGREWFEECLGDELEWHPFEPCPGERDFALKLHTEDKARFGWNTRLNLDLSAGAAEARPLRMAMSAGLCLLNPASAFLLQTRLNLSILDAGLEGFCLQIGGVDALAVGQAKGPAVAVADDV